MYIVAGLGNPGAEYSRNLHNLGFMTIDKLAEKYGVKFEKSGFSAKYSIINVNGVKVMFIKPQTFMNLSGVALKAAASYYKVPTGNIIVAYDDVDIPIGSVRIRQSGSAGTHNGMRSIVNELGSTEFPRVRIGIKPDRPFSLIDYVLSNVRAEDVSSFDSAINVATDAIDEFIKGDSIEKIMCRHNVTKKECLKIT
ncbi:MAG: aminoacyl-tRNA hydrolase [Candidatus Borkfalkiaceae bacterium]|nr:aminoacyl-tRNA hydrolase [Eubacteriales bacterium]MDY5819968.1 aminoacyl-tRNA hydrolase [Christensenellaceae bacterium]